MKHCVIAFQQHLIEYHLQQTHTQWTLYIHQQDSEQGPKLALEHKAQGLWCKFNCDTGLCFNGPNHHKELTVAETIIITIYKAFQQGISELYTSISFLKQPAHKFWMTFYQQDVDIGAHQSLGSRPV